MKTASELFEGKTSSLFKTWEKSVGGVNSYRADVVDTLCHFMDGDTHRFKYWLGRTRKLYPALIYRLIAESREAKNPPAFFEWRLKKELCTLTNAR